MKYREDEEFIGLGATMVCGRHHKPIVVPSGSTSSFSSSSQGIRAERA